MPFKKKKKKNYSISPICNQAVELDCKPYLRFPSGAKVQLT